MTALYFDAVLDAKMMPVFNGTREETVAWLKDHPEAFGMDVCLGRSLMMVTVPEFLEAVEYYKNK